MKQMEIIFPYYGKEGRMHVLRGVERLDTHRRIRMPERKYSTGTNRFTYVVHRQAASKRSKQER